MTAPVPFARKASILDRLAARLFPATQMLDPSVSQGVGRQGLLNIGTNLLQAGGPQAQQQGTLANIGGAISGVDIQGLTQQALKMQAYQQQRQVEQRVQQVAQGTRGIKDPYQRVAAMVTELAGEPGTEDLVGKLSNVLAQLKPERPLRARYVFKELEESPGKFATFRVNEDDPTDRIRIGVGRDPVGLTMPTEGERRAGALYTVGENAYTDLTADFGTPTFKDWLGGKVPLGLGQSWISSTQQRRNQAGADFYRSYLYIVSGATVNPGEAMEQALIIIPQLGDSPEVVKQKLHGLEVKQEAMRQAMGRAAGGAKPKPPPTAGNFDDFLTPRP
jgi:hypothetical protein